MKIKTRNYWVGLFFLLKNYKRRYGSIPKHIARYNQWQHTFKDVDVQKVDSIDDYLNELREQDE